MFEARGRGAGDLFRHEAGGHRWQRVPPNEKRDRVHTSTVTVAVLRPPAVTELVIPDRDLDWTTCRGSGAGGQHRNKTESAVVVTHLPTGLVVRCESERSQKQNRETALQLLRARLFAQKEAAEHGARAADRRRQVGSGQRGDKRRTIQCQNGVVVDHVLGTRIEVRAYLRGDVEGLWPGQEKDFLTHRGK